MTTTTATDVQAQALKVGDQFEYSHSTVTVEAVTPLSERFVEVTVTDQDAPLGKRWIDFGRTETVGVVSGPSTKVAPAPVVQVKTATQRAREAVRLGKVRSLPASAALVLYALAAAQDEAEAWQPTLGSVATGAGLAISTTRGHLVALRGKGLVREDSFGGWSVSA